MVSIAFKVMVLIQIGIRTVLHVKDVFNIIITSLEVLIQACSLQ